MLKRCTGIGAGVARGRRLLRIERSQYALEPFRGLHAKTGTAIFGDYRTTPLPEQGRGDEARQAVMLAQSLAS